MTKNFITRIKSKKDTASNWQSLNPTLLDGEIVIVETDEGLQFKVGDGTNRYSQLPFVYDAISQDKIDEICNSTNNNNIE